MICKISGKKASSHQDSDIRSSMIKFSRKRRSYVMNISYSCVIKPKIKYLINQIDCCFFVNIPLQIHFWLCFYDKVWIHSLVFILCRTLLCRSKCQTQGLIFHYFRQKHFRLVEAIQLKTVPDINPLRCLHFLLYSAFLRKIIIRKNLWQCLIRWDV